MEFKERIEEGELQKLREILKGKTIVFTSSIPKEKGEANEIIKAFTREDKLFVQLADGRELGIPIDWFDRWGIENVTVDKLQEYEISWGGGEVWFPQIGEEISEEERKSGRRVGSGIILNVFLYGWDALCCYD